MDTGSSITRHCVGDLDDEHMSILSDGMRMLLLVHALHGHDD